MDSYNLKKDNRKKFYDKQRLKHRHATKSDIKYLKKLNKEQNNTDPSRDTELEQLPSNEHRYTGDILYVPPEQDKQLQMTSKYANMIIKQKLLDQGDTGKNTLEENVSLTNGHVTSRTTLKGKDIMQMDVDSLNKIIRGGGIHEDIIDDSTLKSDSNSSGVVVDGGFENKNYSDNTTSTKPTAFKMDVAESFVPDDLKEDEAFLDQFL